MPRPPSAPEAPAFAPERALLPADTPERARAAGLDARARLADNDAYGCVAARGDLVVAGPTRTNVNEGRS